MAQAKLDSGFDKPSFDLHKAVYDGDFSLVRTALDHDCDVNEPHFRNGLTPLHIAVGSDHLAIAQYLVRKKAKFTSDPQGRMPSIIAVECVVSDEMYDWVVDAEAIAEAV